MHTPRLGSRILLFGGVFAVTVTALRIFILFAGGRFVTEDYLAGIALGAAGEFLYGVVIGWLLERCGRRTAAFALLLLLWGALLLVKIASFHYEAVFGRLPSAELAFYLDQLVYLRSSLEANLPPARVAMEFLAAAGVLYAAYVYLLRLRSTPRFAKVQALSAGGIMAAGIAINAFPAMVPEPYFWGSREPLIWLMQSAMVRERYTLGKLELRPEDFDRFLEDHGVDASRPAVDPRYPLCRVVTDGAARGNGRSAIIFILEGVGYEEMLGSFKGKPLMPDLRRIAEENLSFQRAYAPGIKSAQALTALFSGLPANPFNYYLWRTPFLTFDGLPDVLRGHGYRTAYFHGADLAFERQRQYLEAVGFEHIVEFNPAGDLPAYGWGYDDGIMFPRFREWLERQQTADRPYLAALFTLSSHDPYVLPPDWTPVFSERTRVMKSLRSCCEIEGEQDNLTALAETYRFLDAQIGEFFEWYRGLDNAPVLIIAGDHAPHLVNDNADVANRKMRFDVPLIIAGLDRTALHDFQEAVDRPVGLHDIPVTLLHLLGLPEHSCMMGVDLLGPDARRAASRFLYAAGPESLEKIHIWHRDREFVFNRVTDTLTGIGDREEKDSVAGLGRVRQFIESSLPVHFYLLQKDAYFPALRTQLYESPATAQPREPIYVSHRGNTDGPSAAGLENRAGAFDRAVDRGFEWVELDVQLTRDGVPVIHHDAEIQAGDRTVPLIDLTLDELRSLPGYEDILGLEDALGRHLASMNVLIEAKPQAGIEWSQVMSREVSRIIADRSGRNRIIVDSFEEYLAISIKSACGCQVGLDMPFRKKLGDADLEHVRRMGLDWIYVHYSVVDADLLRAARQHGLKVMAYTVNDQDVIDAWRTAGTLPDGIITDHASLLPGG